MAYPILLVFIMLGLVIMLVPTEIKLKFDGKVGRWIYNRTVISAHQCVSRGMTGYEVNNLKYKVSV